MQARPSSQMNGDVVDLRDYITVLRRRAVAIVVLAALGLGLAVSYSKLQTPEYTASAQVLVNPPPGNTSSNPNNAISVDTEALVVKSETVATAAAKILKSPLLATQLLKHVSVKTAVGTFVLGITYHDPNPIQAAAGANAFAQAYLDYKHTQAQDQINQETSSIEAQIAVLNRKQQKENGILQSNPPGTIAYRAAQDELSQLSVSLGVLASSLAQIPTAIDPGEVLLPASPPKAPSSPKVPLNAAIGLFLGLSLGVVAAFVLDRMDDRVRRGSDLQLYLDAPVLAMVPHVKGRNHERASQLIVHLKPRSPVAEAYRTIRTNVLSMAYKRDMKVFAVVSPMQREGKSMTSANLAAALGQTDKRVLVVSADIRKPGIHEFFGVRNDRGLSEVLEGDVACGEAIERSDVGNVWVLPGGHFPARPAELLQSPAMSDLLATVRLQFDFVIVDCPPVLGLADCLAILPHVDAVLLVAQAGKTRGGAIAEVVDQLDRVGCSVDAAILNDIHVPRGRPGHQAYGYYVGAEEYLEPTTARIEPSSPRRFAPPKPVSARPVSARLDTNGNGVNGNGLAHVGDETVENTAEEHTAEELSEAGEPAPVTSSVDES